MTNYVQHISGQGEKWKVFSFRYGESWKVCGKGPAIYFYNLPWQDYVNCDPPEEWEDVTGECEEEDEGRLLGSLVSLIVHKDGPLMKDKGFRVRKIDYLHNGPCFIVERKKS